MDRAISYDASDTSRHFYIVGDLYVVDRSLLPQYSSELAGVQRSAL